MRLEVLHGFIKELEKNAAGQVFRYLHRFDPAWGPEHSLARNILRKLHSEGYSISRAKDATKFSGINDKKIIIDRENPIFGLLHEFGHSRGNTVLNKGLSEDMPKPLSQILKARNALREELRANQNARSAIRAFDTPNSESIIAKYNKAIKTGYSSHKSAVLVDLFKGRSKSLSWPIKPFQDVNKAVKSKKISIYSGNKVNKKTIQKVSPKFKHDVQELSHNYLLDLLKKESSFHAK
jgi:hypothetical protein